MSSLKIFLFNGVKVVPEGASSSPDITPLVEKLLACLVLHRKRSVPRDKLIEIFWSDASDKRARASLSTALWRLRRALEPDDILQEPYIRTEPTDKVSFNWESDHWIDMIVFEETIKKSISIPLNECKPREIQRLEEAVNLYTGDLLPGYYQDWSLREQERMRVLHGKALTYLLQYYRDHGMLEKSIDSGILLLRHYPLREDVHRQMMRLYNAAGQRALAVKQYKKCSGLLNDELGIEPLEETKALYHQITADGGHMSPGGDFVEDQDTLQITRQKLQTVKRRVDQLSSQLKASLEFIDRMYSE